MLYITVGQHHNYCTSSHPLSYESDILCHIYTHVVWTLLPLFWNEFMNDLLELFSSSFNQLDWYLIMSSCFSISQFTYCHLCLHHLVVQHMALHFVHTLSSLLHNHCLFHLTVWSASHNIHTTFVNFLFLLTMLPSLSLIGNDYSVNPFLILFTSWQKFFTSLLL